MKVNLHTHSTASDGALSPSDLMKKLAYNSVDVCALTDHDTINGIEEARKEALKLGMTFVNGIEISTKIHGLELDFLDENHHTLHLLGLGFNYEQLKYLFDKKDLDKQQRVKDLVDQLIKDGYQIEFIDYGSKRTSVAKALIAKGYANNVQDAFNHIINLYYDRHVDNMTVDEVVTIIHEANGRVIWAHPFDILYNVNKVRITEEQLEMICQKLREHHVDGIEVYYERFSKDQQNFLRHIQNKYNFFASCGTDYHAKPIQSATFMEINPSLIKEVLM
jgi:3',5'-nucleoside bisphosphate phosphatase